MFQGHKTKFITQMSKLTIKLCKSNLISVNEMAKEMDIAKIIS